MRTRWNRLTISLIMLAGAHAVGAAAIADAKEPDTEHVIAIRPDELKYIAIPDMPSCATAAILRGDPRTGASSVLLRLASGCKVPWHWHSANEDLAVISGQGTMFMKDGPPLHFAPGAYTSLPKHHVHHAECTRTCLFFSTADGAFDINYVNDKGEPLSSEQALQETPKPQHTPKPQRTKKTTHKK